MVCALLLGGGAVLGMGYAHQQQAPSASADGVSCVLPPGLVFTAVGQWPYTLNPVHVAQVAAAAGFTGDDLILAVAIASAESSHRPRLTNQNTDSHRTSCSICRFFIFSK